MWKTISSKNVQIRNGKRIHGKKNFRSYNVAFIIIIECLNKQNVPISSQIDFISDKQLMIYVRPELIPESYSNEHLNILSSFNKVKPVV